MKKIIYLLAMVCTMSLFTACSDDDSTVWDTFKGGDYSVWTERLDIGEDFADDVVYDYDIHVTKASDTKANVSIDVFNNGNTQVATYSMQNADIQQKGTDVVISGAASSELSRESAKGNITITISNDNKVKLEIPNDVKTIIATNDEKPATALVAGTWSIRPLLMYDKDGNVTTDRKQAEENSGSFGLTWEVTDDCPDVLSLCKAKDAAFITNGYVNSMLPSSLSTITFTTDGKIYIKYGSEAKNEGEGDANGRVWKIAKEYATYRMESETRMIVTPNIEKILSTVDDNDVKTKEKLSKILNVFKDGVPVNIAFGDRESYHGQYFSSNYYSRSIMSSINYNTVYFYIDREYATTISKSSVLKGIIDDLDDNDLEGYAALVKLITEQLPDLLDHTTRFEAGLILDKK